MSLKFGLVVCRLEQNLSRNVIKYCFYKAVFNFTRRMILYNLAY